MAQQVTLHKDATGHTVVTDDPETISNLQFGQGYRIVPNRPAPEEPPAEPAPTPEPTPTPEPEPLTATSSTPSTPEPTTATLGATTERRRR